MKTRNAALDCLKILSAFAVIVIHVSAENWYNQSTQTYAWLVNNGYNVLVRWSVPMFVMVSGALLLSKDREFSIKRLLLHYLPKTVLVLLFWGIFYHLYHTQNFSLANVWIGVKNLLQAEAYSHLWYLYMLIGLYIATPIVKSYVNHASKENLLYFLLVGACITCVAPFLFQFARFAKLKPLYDALYLSNGVSYIVYYVLGYYLMNFPPSLKVRRALYIVGGTGLLGAAFFGEYMSFVREKAVSYLGYFSPFTFLFCIALFVFMQQ